MIHVTTPLEPETEHGPGVSHLHCDIESRYVEGLEHDLSQVLSVLWSVEWRLGLRAQTHTLKHKTEHPDWSDFKQTCSYHEEAVVLRFSSKVFEDDLLHKLLHQIPVLHHPVTDRPLNSNRTRTHQRKNRSLQNL